MARGHPARGRTLTPRRRPSAAVGLLIAGCLLFILPAFSPPTAQESGVIFGATTTLDGAVVLPGVTVELVDPAGERVGLAVSDGQGRFSMGGVSPGRWTLQASLTGFATVTRAQIEIEGGDRIEINVDLPVGLEEQVDVTASPAGADPLLIPDTATTVDRLSGRLADQAPVRGESFEALLPLLPGVVRAPDGRLNVKGGQETQTGLLVNSVNASDPATGEFGMTLPVDAIDNVTLLPNPYSAEYGRFTAGVSQVETRRGSGQWGGTVNNFIPKFRWRGNQIRGIERFTPRVAFNGPLVKDRVFLAQSLRYRLVKTKVAARPEIENDSRLESFDSFTQVDATLTPRHNLTATVSVFPRDIERINVDTFNPPEVTPNFSQRGFNVAVSERAILSNSALLESTAAVKTYDVSIDGQGGRAMVFQPDINTGNFFNAQNRDTWTVQVSEVLTMQGRGRLGDHVFKVGGDVFHASLSGTSTSRPVEIRRADGSLSQRVTYQTKGPQAVSSTNLAVFAHDRWRPIDGWLLEFGGRVDRDGVLERYNVSPRVGFAIDVGPRRRGALRGGVGLFYDQTPLNVKAFESYETPTITRFAEDGSTPLGPPVSFSHALTATRTPRSLTWNVEYDHRLNDHVIFRINHLRRSGDREYLLDPIQTADNAILRVDSRGRSRYWELELTSRVVKGPHEMHLTYVRSRATADLNSFDEFFGNFRNPIVRPNDFSLTATDTPHRFLFRGSFLVKEWRVSPVVEWRQGFPYSVVDEDQRYLGVRNRGGRFPKFFTLDLDVQRRVRIFGLNPRVGLRVFHLFNNSLPRDVQRNIDSLSFRQFSNPIERTFGLTVQFG